MGRRPGNPEVQLASLRTQINEYIRRSPADPENVEPVKRFCAEGIQLFAGFVLVSHRIHYPGQVGNLESKFEAATLDQTSFRLGYVTRERFERKDGRLFLTPPSRPTFPNPRPRGFDGIIYHTSFIDPALPRFEYAELLTTQFFRGYDYRYLMFLAKSKLPHKSPLMELFALALLEDVAKKHSVEGIKAQLRRISPAKPSYNLIPPETADQAVVYIKNQIEPTQYHLGYLGKIKAVETRLREVHSINDDQEKLLRDLAFFRKADLANGVLTALLDPVMDSVGQLQWDEALSARDFLLANFKHCFPEWRQAAYPNGVSYQDLDSLAKDRRTLAGVPILYQPLISTHIDGLTGNERSQRQFAMDLATEARERQRLERLTRKLKLYTLAAASKAQLPNVKPFNPDKPLSETNPLVLRFKFQINRPGDGFYPLYQEAFTEEEGNLLMTGNRGILLEQIFFNLLYEGDITIATLREAYQNMATSEILRGTEMLDTIFAEITKVKLQTMEKEFAIASASSAENYGAKIQIIQNTLSALRNQ